MAISDYLNSLIDDRDTLVANLTTKGITGLTGDETFTELVPEVLNIPSGGSTPDWVPDYNVNPNIGNGSSDSIWTDGDNIYWSSGTKHYVFDKTTSTWIVKSWTTPTTNSFNGYNIWSDGTNIYCSNGTANEWILDKTNLTWSNKTWNGFTNLTSGS